MSYSADSFSAGEQPTTAKFNKLWSNDASFNDGTGIANLSWATTALYNPYKFRAYLNSATNSVNGNKIVPFDTENFDTNNNFDVTINKGRYTAPISGFYWFTSVVAGTTNASYEVLSFFKNGANVHTGAAIAGGGFNAYSTISTLLQLTAGDYVEVNLGSGAVWALSTGATATVFTGMLVSTT